jgi:hypothetical protein
MPMETVSLIVNCFEIQTGTDSEIAQDEVVQLEFEEIKETLRLEKQFERNTWSELWRTKGNRHRLIILLTAGLFSQWSGNGNGDCGYKSDLANISS